jgi:integrase
MRTCAHRRARDTPRHRREPRWLRDRLADPHHPLPCYRLPGGKILVRRSEFDGWLASYRQVGRADVERIVAEVLRTGLIALRLILQHALRAKLIATNPAVGLGRFPRNDEETVDPFTPGELHAIVAASRRQNPAVATFLQVWAQSGMRAGEVSSLRWGDLDLARGIAVVQRTYSRGRIGPTKTRRARAVSLLHPVIEETAEWRPGATAECCSVLADLRQLAVQSLDPEAYVFRRTTGEPWNPMTVLRMWKRAITGARVRYRPPEQLRHTFASTLLSRNAPLLYVQKQGGWRSASVLLRVYARWMPQEYGDVTAHPSATPAQPAVAAVFSGSLASAS